MRISHWFVILLLLYSTVNGDINDDDENDNDDDDDYDEVKRSRKTTRATIEKTRFPINRKKKTTEPVVSRKDVTTPSSFAGHDDSWEHGNSSQGHGNSSEHHGIRLASWRWHEFGAMFDLMLLMIFAAIAKITFHHIDWLSQTIPESVVLITIGFCITAIIKMIHKQSYFESGFPKFTASLFFNYLLPPIILDASFALFDREFLANFRSVITFAVIGTLINIFAIGYTLYGLSYAGVFGKFHGGKDGDGPPTYELTATQCLIFSSLISAVDPVAVLAIFEEIHVNMGLYFLVFGESLLNDGVTVVVYNTMIALETIDPVGVSDIFLACLSFMFVFFGGFIVGMLWGVFASFITTKTTHVRVVEPLLIFSSAYMAFVFAELIHWSGILSIIGFGLTVKRYAFANVSQKSYHTVKYATKTLASISDCIIFIYLGRVIWVESHEVNWCFILATIITCLVYRFISTFFLSWITNKSRGNKISIQEQIIMTYGGLRGAVGFSLAVVLQDPDENNGSTWYRHIFLTGALSMVIFTVFIQGTTIKPLVKFLKIKLQETGCKKLVSSEMQLKMVDDMMAGIEIIVGSNGTWTAFQKIRRFDTKYIKRVLTTNEYKDTLQGKFEKIILDEHFANLYAPNIMIATTKEKQPSLKSTPSEDLKSLSAGIYNKHMQMSRGSRYMVNQMEMRQERTKTVSGEVMRKRMSQHISPNDESVQLRGSGTASLSPLTIDRMNPLFDRSVSHSPTYSRVNSSRVNSALNRTSVSSQLIKLEYDTMQANKKRRISQIGRSASRKTSEDTAPLTGEGDYSNAFCPLVEEDDDMNYDDITNVTQHTSLQSDDVIHYNDAPV